MIILYRDLSELMPSKQIDLYDCAKAVISLDYRLWCIIIAESWRSPATDGMGPTEPCPQHRDGGLGSGCHTVHRCISDKLLIAFLEHPLHLQS